MSENDGWVAEDSPLKPVENEVREVGELLAAGFGAVLGAVVILAPSGGLIALGWYVGDQLGSPFEAIGLVIGGILGVVFFMGVLDEVNE